MKNIILPTEGTVPRIECAYGYVAIHCSESEAVLIGPSNPLGDLELLAEVPNGLPALCLFRLGIITEAEYEALKPGEKRRLVLLRLEQDARQMAALAASIEQQRVELEAME